MAEEAKFYCFWLLDTRAYWHGNKIDDAASDAFKCLSADEKTKSSAFHFVKDAKLSLGSSLLKRFFIVKSLDRPWPEATFSRQGDPKHGKPGYDSPASESRRVDFNVSHQAGLVALAGGRSSTASFGVDIVCVDERDSARSIQRQGFDKWVDGFMDVFSPEDMHSMKAELPPESAIEDDSLFDTEAKIRRFYAFWALKEAFIKLVGEGLIANWLKDVEFRNVRVPKPPQDQKWGETISKIQVWVKGEEVQDVMIVLQAFEKNYMIATAMKDTSVLSADLPAIGKYETLDPERDILPYALRVSHG